MAHNQRISCVLREDADLILADLGYRNEADRNDQLDRVLKSNKFKLIDFPNAEVMRVIKEWTLDNLDAGTFPITYTPLGNPLFLNN